MGNLPRCWIPGRTPQACPEWQWDDQWIGPPLEDSTQKFAPMGADWAKGLAIELDLCWQSPAPAPLIRF